MKRKRKTVKKQVDYYSSTDPKIAMFTAGERDVIKFVKKYFGIYPGKKFCRNTRLSELTDSAHGVINFTFAIEKDREIEFNDLETEYLCCSKGTLEMLFRILKSHKALMKK